MELKKIELRKLKENLWNPNFMQDKEFAALVSQIKRFGMRQPILVRPCMVNKQESDFEKQVLEDIPFPEYEIIDGAHRVRASVEAGLTEIDCVVVELSDSQAKTATIAMNKLKGQMDDLSLAKLLEALKEELGKENLSELSGIPEREINVLLKFLELPEDLSKLAETTSDLEQTLTFVLTKKQADFIESVLAKIDAKNKSFALWKLCNFFDEKHK
jgi:ParB/RepB/Spo0J family partition protein